METEKKKALARIASTRALLYYHLNMKSYDHPTPLKLRGASKKMKEYNHLKIEKKWQAQWEKKKVYKTKDSTKEKKFYVLDMFPYLSGEGLHVGHPKGYIATDIVSRMKRMQGFNVLHPMGFDAFGLPAENYAIKTKTNPEIAVKKNVTRFKKQLEILGFDYDWAREIKTSDPKFYKWTQWIFLKLLEKGLAYESNEPVNWCPKDKTVLANEDVENGRCERCGTLVEKRPMRQWVLKITDYADRMLKDLNLLDWPESIKESQRNWIGRSEGMLFTAPVKDTDLKIQTFSAHFEAFAADTFVVIAPDHPFLKTLIKGTPKEKEVLNFANNLVIKRNNQDFGNNKDPEGIFTGRYIIDPVGNGDLPIWVASYALAEYGTGIVKCSAHDERDFAFAKKYNIPLKEVLIPRMIDRHDPPRPDKKTVFRKAIQAIVIDPKTKKVLVLKWKKFPWTTFITGGVEEGEDKIEAAKREILEESGYKNVKYVKTLGGEVESHFFANHKDENRKAMFTGLVFELENEERTEPTEEEKTIHEVAWMSWEELAKDKNIKCSEYELWLDRLFNQPHAWTDMKNSVLTEPKEFAGKVPAESREEIMQYLEKHELAERKVSYRLKDWVFSRQRYWGEPIPVLKDGDKVIPVPEKDLPVKLPKVKNYEPTGTGESPLANIKNWVNIILKRKDGKMERLRRETNTMPQWAGSSWYYLRYMDPKNKKKLVDPRLEKYWNQVDFYVGGAEHATRHLIYARFWHKFLYDIGVVSTKEPFKKLQSVGLIMGPDGRKMSKRFGNVINPDEIVAIWGADSLRLYEMFMGPFADAIAWNTDNMIGVRRFLEKIWRMKDQKRNDGVSGNLILIQKTIKKVTEDIENMKFNTAISSLMILVNEREKKQEGFSKKEFEVFLKLLAPFAPHITEELWANLGNKKSIHLSDWPKYDPKEIVEESVKIAVQINGKIRGIIDAESDTKEEDIKNMALNMAEITKWTEGKEIKKVIYVQGKVLNLVLT